MEAGSKIFALCGHPRKAGLGKLSEKGSVIQLISATIFRFPKFIHQVAIDHPAARLICLLLLASIQLSAGNTFSFSPNSNFTFLYRDFSSLVPRAPVLTYKVTNIACIGGRDGAIDVTVTGASGILTYAWNDGFTGEDRNGLAAGTYSVTVFEDMVPYGPTTITVDTDKDLQPPAIICPDDITKYVAEGVNSAIINYQVPVGKDNCPGVSTFQISGLASGSSFPLGITTNTFRATDVAGNSSTCSFTVTVADTSASSRLIKRSPKSVIATVSTTNVTCNGANDGTITISGASGAVSGIYEYSINGGSSWQSSGNYTNLNPGTYNVMLRDKNNTSDFTILNAALVITQPATLTISANSNAPLCGGQTLNLTSSPAGGTTGYTYSWTGPSGFSSFVQNPSKAGVTAGDDGTYIVTVTDANGCTATADTKVNINNIPSSPTVPNVTICPNTSVTLIANGAVAPEDYKWYDAASGGNLLQTDGNYTTPVLLATTTYYVSKYHQVKLCESSRVPLVVTVQDNQKPVISGCPGNININSDAGLCTAMASWTEPTATDNCLASGPLVWTKSHLPGAVFPKGVTTVTYTATDYTGNVSLPCTFTVTVTDNENPVISCPVNISVNNTAGTCGAIVNYTAPVGTDNCAGPTTVQTAGLASGATFPVGTTTNTFRVTDASGLTATCSFTVTVTDNENPVIACPANISVNNTAGTCGAVVNYTAPVGTDNCAGSTTVQTAGLAPGATFPIGTTTNTFKVTDAAGLTATCSFTVIVTDNENPVISCPVNISVNNTAGTCGAVVNYTAPVGTDNCAGPTTVQTAGLASGATFPVGTTTNTFKVTDAAGLTATCSFTVTVTDNQAPVLTCPSNISQSAAPGSCNASVITPAPVNSDNCAVTKLTWTIGGATVAVSSATGTNYLGTYTFNSGISTITYTATDAAGNTSTCSFTVTINDNTPPVISNCPTNISVNTGAGRTTCDQTASWTEPTATDNCSPAVSLTWTKSHLPGAVFPVGTTTVTYTVKDLANNISTCSFTVTVVDNTPPTFTAPIAITIYPNASCAADTIPSVTGSPVTLFDNCTPAASLVVTHSNGNVIPGACAGTYSFTRSWRVTDQSGNTTTGTQVITVADNTAPLLTVPPAKTIECNTSILPANTGQATATDNCGAPVTFTYVDNSVPGNCTGRATITRTWTARDCSGNTTTGSQTINIQDTQPPTISCSNFSVANPNAIPSSDLHTNVTANDNCGGSIEYILTYEDYAGLTNKPGFCPTSVTRKYVARDVCGNTSLECTQVITILDISGCAVCQETVPFFSAILDGAPDSLWTSPSVVRQDICCGAKGPPPPRCISFNVYLDKDAVGLIFNIATGAVPPGALFFQVDCGPEIAVGEAICLAGGRFYTVTFCKPGNNQNTYSIQSISGITGGSGLVTRADANCAGQLSYSGVDPNTITWTVKSPNDQSLLRYLSCTNCPNPIFTPDSITPPEIVYTVCGTLLGTNKCGNTAMTDCKDVTVTTLPKIVVAFNLDPGNICKNNIPTIDPNIQPATYVYDYKWYSGPNGTGSVLSTASTWKPPDQGSYSLVVSENQTGIKCNTATFNFRISFDTLGPVILGPAAPLDLECNDPLSAQKIVDWIATVTATDNGVSVTVTNNYTGITQACNTVLPVIFTATDICGNTSTVSSDIRIHDTQAPTWITAAGALDRALSCSDAAGIANAQALVPVAADNCDVSLTPVKVAGSFVEGSCPNAGTFTNTFTARDACNNVSGIFTQVITIIDNTPPVITVPAQNLTVECDGSGNQPDRTNWLNTHAGADAADACPGTITWTNNFTTLTPACGATGSALVTFTATDACGNTATTQATFNIADTQPPVISCPPPVNAIVDPNQCFATGVLLGNAIAADNCSNTVVINNAPATYPVGITNVIWTATDACGNTSTCEQVVTVTDNQLPVITCPANEEQIAIDGGCSKTNVTITNPTFSENCVVDKLLWTMTGATTGNSSNSGINYVSGQTFNIGITTVTYTVYDLSGNSASCSFTVWIKDIEKPIFVFGCPADVTQDAGPGSCEANVTVLVPVVSDPCNELVSIVNSFNGTADASGTYPVGVTNVTWTITDISGNTNTCLQKITIIDNQLPVISCPANEEQVAIDGGCSKTNVIITDPTFSDNCPIDKLLWTMSGATTGNSANTGINYVSGQTFNVGITTVTYTVYDNSGNTASCSSTVWIKDIEKPIFVFGCPADVTQDAGPGSCEANVTVPVPQVSDPCNELVSIVNSFNGTDNASGIYPIGVTTINWTITDVSGNTNTCKQTITIKDNELPVINCPANEEQVAINGGCSKTNVTITDPTFSDNCPIDKLLWTMSGATTGNSANSGINYVSGQTFNVGITTVTYTVYDNSGNTASCSFTVWIKDIEKPVFVVGCPADIVQDVGPGTCDANITIPVPLVSDPCNELVSIVNSFNGTDNASGTYPVGVTNVTWTITDISGNTNTCLQKITITDNELPVINCPGNQEQVAINGGCEKTDVTITDPTFSDNCTIDKLLWTMSGATTGNSPNTGINYVTGQTFHVGITTVTYTVYDLWGNTASCSFTVWIKDILRPEFVVGCPADVIQDADPDSCNAVVTVPVPLVTDPCNELVSIVNSFNGTADASGTYLIGVTNVTWTITDASGNINTCSQTITINDLLPSLSCPPSIVVNADFDKPYASHVSIGTPVYSDNCPGLTLSWIASNPTPGASLLTGINIETVSVYYVGVTTITYTLTDANNNTATCSFTVTVLAKPIIICQNDSTRNNDPGLCNASIDPGFPTLVSGVEPVTWTWEMTGATTASGSGRPIIPNPYPFNVGTTIITWTATNTSGSDTCTQRITIIDNEPATFTAEPKTFCVENIHEADYYDPTVDITPTRPDYYTLKAGDISLDVTALNDNCCADTSLVINWRIDFVQVPNPAPPPNNVSTLSISGTGQPSTYGADIQLPGDGVTFLDVTHTITYWITDCHGNISPSTTVNIVVKPRPNVVKQ